MIDPMIGAAIRHAYYCDHIDHLHLAAGDDDDLPLPTFIDIKGLTAKAVKSVYDGIDGLVEPNLFQLTNEAIGHAISVGVLQYGKPNPAFLAHMQRTGTWFSARKSYQQQQELAKLLMSDDGKTKRPWKDFQKAAQPIVGTYNQTWLKTEYNTAIRAARNGSRWQEYEANADLYPNLEYLPSRAATPRDDHKPFYHVVRPLTDDFWTNHYPPSEYNCQCGVEPTDGDVTPLPEKQPKPAPGLDHNPGQTEQVFSDTHPYTARLKAEGADLTAIDQDGERLQREADYKILNGGKALFDKAMTKTESLKAAFPKIDHEELASIWSYTDNSYADLNRFLRGSYNEATDDDRQYYEAYQRVLSAALEKMPRYKKDVFRGVDLSDDLIAEYRSCLKRGKSIQHNCYTSTATKIANSFSGNVKMVIQSTNGRRIANVSKYGKSEDEVLFDAGTRFKVEKIETIGKQTWIYLKESKR